MTSTVKLIAAAALLGVLGGCANWMPNWSPNTPTDSLQDPPIYSPAPLG
ncbi:MAG: hypothetical protein JWO70_1392 [Betaproteobacteria bacterium]|jgi:hypothetical protein|nr:hypothetical protein [Betaproteobacteria bacterium]